LREGAALRHDYFNPTRVRLKRGVLGDCRRLGIDFNPTRVRLKLILDGDDLVKYTTSTPQGCV